MPDLDFGTTPEQNLMVLRNFATKVNADLYNSGRDGLITQFTKFVTEHNARESERDKAVEDRHRENAEKLSEISNRLSHRSLAWTVAGVLVGVFALIASIVGIMVAVHIAKTGSIPSLHSNVPALADTVSTIPRLR